jgi:MYXO-CTERM domain-containing protein
MRPRLLILVTLCLVVARPAAAHTDSDVVAVPAGAPAEVTLKPTHGCGDSATIKVSTRVPVAGATAGEVDGWTATVALDDAGRTVIEWSGGPLLSDETGAFPVQFTAPDDVGELLLFPFLQECENGESLSWINGDPASDNPAPRLLILPAGSEPAPTIDDVPADAPGREQLTQVVDVDNPREPASTTTTNTASSGTSPTTIEDAADDEEGDPPWPAIVIGAVVALGLGGLGVHRLRRQR